ncbi:hypothetical protein J6590_062353 [Homalodisca vitripennis]|nr:hypothetical protein J6590_062353 [Homalodisca vitripennis]
MSPISDVSIITDANNLLIEREALSSTLYSSHGNLTIDVFYVPPCSGVLREIPEPLENLTERIIPTPSESVWECSQYQEKVQNYRRV